MPTQNFTENLLFNNSDRLQKEFTYRHIIIVVLILTMVIRCLCFISTQVKM